MSDIAIRVENLGKRYRIGEEQARYKTLRESLIIGLNNLRSRSKNEQERIVWALKDVSFEVKRGEAIGVIGRNGAGKSTLLKVLAHITRPTMGRVEIHGRVGSLLEVGTGFHPELTGRDNIYLNGAILGMKRAEIDRKFDEIVAFAEIEKFLDTPSKHYSSGMYMRLAFAVAAHLEPEILLVDEVLAVGDAEFQKKCLGKMGEVTKEGRTVLFVSHNMSAINNICSEAILIDDGNLVIKDKSLRVTDAYSNKRIQKNFTNRITQDLTKSIWIVDFGIVDESGKFTNYVQSGKNFDLHVIIENKNNEGPIALGISVEDVSGTRIFGGLSINDGIRLISKKGKTEIRYFIEKLPLNEGVFNITIAIHKLPSLIIADRLNQCMSFEVINSSGNTQTNYSSASNGLIIVSSQWIQT